MKEQELYEFIKKNTEVTIQMIKDQLSEQHIGALGKLIQAEKIIKYKKKIAEDSGYSKMIPYYGIKQIKEPDVENDKTNITQESITDEQLNKENEIIAKRYYSLKAQAYDILNLSHDVDIDWEYKILNILQNIKERRIN